MELEPTILEAVTTSATAAILIFALMYVIYLALWIAYELRPKHIPQKERITAINRQLLEAGMNLDQIMEFWEECMAEAEILHNLPPCSCKDVNDCETWCQTKARFVMNPPED